MHQKHLLRFIKSKLRKEGDEVVIFRDGKYLTLREVFQSLKLTGWVFSLFVFFSSVRRSSADRAPATGGGGRKNKRRRLKKKKTRSPSRQPIQSKPIQTTHRPSKTNPPARSYDLNVDTLDMHVDKTTFHRFDRFNLKYNPCGQSRLREIFIKQDNLIHGRFLAELTREVREAGARGIFGGVCWFFFAALSSSLRRARRHARAPFLFRPFV